VRALQAGQNSAEGVRDARETIKRGRADDKEKIVSVKNKVGTTNCIKSGCRGIQRLPP